MSDYWVNQVEEVERGRGRIRRHVTSTGEKRNAYRFLV
jgi:hypothetical protein